jgi:hypothetical protein
VSAWPRIVLSPGVTLTGWDAKPAALWMRPGTVLDCQPGSKLEAAITGCGGALSPVISPRDPRRSDEMGGPTFSKAALGN